MFVKKVKQFIVKIVGSGQWVHAYFHHRGRRKPVVLEIIVKIGAMGNRLWAMGFWSVFIPEGGGPRHGNLL